MNDEKEVLCWCCEYFWPYDPDFPDACLLKRTQVSAFGKVCEEFLLNSGLSTQLKIPEYCKNYNKKRSP